MKRIIIFLLLLTSTASYSQLIVNGWRQCNTGTTHGTVAWQISVPAAYSSNIYSLNFDGSTAYITPTNIISVGDDGAISFWLKTANSINGILGLSTANNYTALTVGSTIYFEVADGSNWSLPISSSDGNWHNYIINRVSGVTHIYQDGTESSTGGISQSGTWTCDEIGKYYDGSSNWLNGNLAELRIFGVHLSGTDISNIVAGSPTIQSSTLRWKINEGTGTIINCN